MVPGCLYGSTRRLGFWWPGGLCKNQPCQHQQTSKRTAESTAMEKEQKFNESRQSTKQKLLGYWSMSSFSICFFFDIGSCARLCKCVRVPRFTRIPTIVCRCASFSNGNRLNFDAIAKILTAGCFFKLAKDNPCILNKSRENQFVRKCEVTLLHCENSVFFFFFPQSDIDSSMADLSAPPLIWGNTKWNDNYLASKTHRLCVENSMLLCTCYWSERLVKCKAFLMWKQYY